MERSFNIEAYNEIHTIETATEYVINIIVCNESWGDSYILYDDISLFGSPQIVVST